ncbi:unnamed protein product [Lepidochelys kempii]
MFESTRVKVICTVGKAWNGLSMPAGLDTAGNLGGGMPGLRSPLGPRHKRGALVNMYCLFGQVLLDFRTGLQVNINTCRARWKMIQEFSTQECKSDFPMFIQELIDSIQGK